MSKILCIIDGMTDPEFNVDHYPILSQMHLTRYINTTHGQVPESLGCILRLLGIKKVPEHLRGYVEALGYGIPVNANDLVLRGSWYALDKNGRCKVPISAPDSLEGVEGCRYYPLEQYKSLLVFPGMASFVSDLVTYPPYGCADSPADQLCPQGCSVVERVFQSQLSQDKCLLLWGQSVSKRLTPFPQKAAVICGTPIVKGIAKLLGMDDIPVVGATGDVDTDLIGKAAAALETAKTYPFVLLHINGADEAAHRRNRAEKQAFLKRVNDLVIPLLIHSRHELYVTGDHGTDATSGTHIAQMQPVFSNVGPVECRKAATETVPRQASMNELQWRVWAVERLQKKADEVGRIPTKADFESVEIIRIKTVLGPWPRALEAAGLKEPKEKKNPSRR